MTDRAYYHSDDLEMIATVNSCIEDENGQYRVTLAATLFHPQGGGQPADRGTLGGVEVLNVMQIDGEVIHFLAAAVAGEVNIQVDAATRRLHSRLHSAGHLIGNAAVVLGWRAIKGDHRPGSGRIVCQPLHGGEAVDIERLQRLTNDLVQADLARELSEQDGQRWVTWGDLPAWACGGTHVATTGQTGEVCITAAKIKKGQLSVQYQLAE